ncbi:MAG: RluA family pseudouridine synthase [Alphaproteobacteria bacterium]|nr:RluA family pseudouridine synthase [Alphaproteobacteria bacterium]
MERVIVNVEENDAGGRLDKVLAAHAPSLSRARVQALLAKGHVADDAGALVSDASRKVRTGDAFVITIPPAVDADPVPQDIALDIRYEDDHLLVLNKPVGLVVHPAAGNHDGTLVNALLAHCGESLSGIGGVKRPGIVHRLDKETSGLMVVAKTDAAHQGLAAQLADRSLKRVYHAIVWGVPNPSKGRIETGIGRDKKNRKKMAVVSGGKNAITDYETAETFGLLAARVVCRLQTGRTHQIRVHMGHSGHHLVGDSVYGKSTARRFLKLQKAPPDVADTMLSFPRQALHAAEIAFLHPVTGKKISVAADCPEDMISLLEMLRGSI